jgi:hypothetical protein
MLVQILILAAGLALIVLGAEFLVDGASSIARKAGISEFVIGLTIIGMGTSAPEFVVSLFAAVKGNADIAVGNVIGSNIFNILLILGITAMILPIEITESNRKRDIPINIGATLLLVVLGMNGTIFGLGANSLSRIDGIVFILIFIWYMYTSFKRNESPIADENEKIYSIGLSTVMVIGGLASLVYGGNIFVDSATNIAKMAGVSDKFIAITLLAGGTSLPELATCIVAAVKNKGQLALGNILGSNIFNILLILGTSAIIRPLSMDSINFVDLSVLMLSVVMIWASIYTGKKNKLDKAEGLVFLLLEALYLVYLFKHA